MSRIFLTGDTHSDFNRFSADKFPEGKNLTKDDIVIILGDYGGVWYSETSQNFKGQERNNKWLNEKPWTTAFIDGNHENFDRLNALPVVDFYGGKAHQVDSSIFHLMRGEVFIFNGKKYLAIGGANSIDKEGRTIGKSWWPEELHSRTEEEHVLDAIKQHNNYFDYILTHTCPDDLKELMRPELMKLIGLEIDPTEKFLEHVLSQLNFKHHYFGHFHMNKKLDMLHTVLYRNIVEIL